MDSRNNIVSTSGEQLRRHSQWQLDTTSAPESSELDMSNKYYLSTGLDLCVVQKREGTSSRPIIPATKCEKLTYIRSYVSYTSKTDSLGIRFIDYNRLFWNYLQGAFLKTLPSCYLYLFLGSYAPQHHLFLTKMAPLLNGLNIVWILIGVLQLSFSTHVQILYMNFFINGLLYQRPWNRCNSTYYSVTSDSRTDWFNISCLTLDQFIARTQNISLTTYDDYFLDPATNEYIQISHFFNAWFNRNTLKETIIIGISWTVIYCNIIWISSSLLINQIFKRSIWKILHVAHWMLVIFFACVLLFLYYFAAVNVNLSEVKLNSSPRFEEQMRLDLEFLTESMTAPPVLHLLTSRSKNEVKLSTDSTLILASNTIFYLFRSYVLDKLLRYCVHLANAQWQLVYMETNIFFLWPIFFSSVGLDSVLTIPFSILIFMVDYFTFVITHHFLIEVIICEWQFFKRWHAALILFILANMLSERWYQLINWLILYAIRAATSTELLIITFLYPLSRLLEDITFHNGIAASLVAVLALRVVFLYYFIKFLHWSSSTLYTQELPMTYRKGVVIALLLLMLVALLIKFYDIVIIHKKVWKLIFVPIVDWGPFDLTLRLLRKKFDSSTYIESQAPRELSRYLIQKAEPKSYKLDIRYD